MAPLETLGVEPWGAVAVFKGAVGVAIAAIVTVLAAGVGVVVVKIGVVVAGSVNDEELVSAAVDVVTAPQVLGEMFGSWLLSTKYALPLPLMAPPSDI